jgi:hypothetical protein
MEFPNDGGQWKMNILVLWLGHGNNEVMQVFQ